MFGGPWIRKPAAPATGRTTPVQLSQEKRLPIRLPEPFNAVAFALHESETAYRRSIEPYYKLLELQVPATALRIVGDYTRYEYLGGLAYDPIFGGHRLAVRKRPWSADPQEPVLQPEQLEDQLDLVHAVGPVLRFKPGYRTPHLEFFTDSGASEGYFYDPKGLVIADERGLDGLLSGRVFVEEKLREEKGYAFAMQDFVRAATGLFDHEPCRQAYFEALGLEKPT